MLNQLCNLIKPSTRYSGHF